MEAEKSQDLLSTSWRTSKARGAIQYDSKGSRTKIGQKMGIPAQTENKFTLLLPFCSVQVLNELDDAHSNW